MKNNLFCLLLLVLSPSAFAIVNDYQFSGTIDGMENEGAFSGHFVYDSTAGMFSGGGGVANREFISFSAAFTAPGITMNYPDQTFTRKYVSVRNIATEDSDWIYFFADNWTPDFGQSKILRIDLKDYDKTVFPGSPEFPPLPVSLNLSDFEYRKFTILDDQYQFTGTITNLTLVPEPATLLLFALAWPLGRGLALRRKN